jgi:hypothetical protein
MSMFQKSKMLMLALSFTAVSAFALPPSQGPMPPQGGRFGGPDDNCMRWVQRCFMARRCNMWVPANNGSACFVCSRYYRGMHRIYSCDPSDVAQLGTQGYNCTPSANAGGNGGGYCASWGFRQVCRWVCVRRRVY